VSIWVGALILYSIFLKAGIEEYNAFSVSTSIEAKFGGIQKFPSVTFCNGAEGVSPTKENFVTYVGSNTPLTKFERLTIQDGGTLRDENVKALTAICGRCECSCDVHWCSLLYCSLVVQVLL
jgi:hypothetical protein